MKNFDKVNKDFEKALKDWLIEAHEENVSEILNRWSSIMVSMNAVLFSGIIADTCPSHRVEEIIHEFMAKVAIGTHATIIGWKDTSESN